MTIFFNGQLSMHISFILFITFILVEIQTFMVLWFPTHNGCWLLAVAPLCPSQPHQKYPVPQMSCWSSQYTSVYKTHQGWGLDLLARSSGSTQLNKNLNEPMDYFKHSINKIILLIDYLSVWIMKTFSSSCTLCTKLKLGTSFSMYWALNAILLELSPCEESIRF